jgi:hypothetical protein
MWQALCGKIDDAAGRLPYGAGLIEGARAVILPLLLGEDEL